MVAGADAEDAHHASGGALDGILAKPEWRLANWRCADFSRLATVLGLKASVSQVAGGHAELARRTAIDVTGIHLASRVSGRSGADVVGVAAVIGGLPADYSGAGIRAGRREGELAVAREYSAAHEVLAGWFVLVVARQAGVTAAVTRGFLADHAAA